MTQQTDGFSLSFEVYPPRTPAGWDSLSHSLLELDRVDPAFISVTFGAGGHGSEKSLDVLRFIRDHTQTLPLAHVTCVSSTDASIRALVQRFIGEGILHFLALRGDLPEDRQATWSGPQTANELVELISRLPDWPHTQSGPRSTSDLGERCIAVAAFPNGHPESGPGRSDIDALKAKQDAGADFAITQLFFDPDDYLRFVDRVSKAGVTLPILPGLLPVTNLARLGRAVELSNEQWPVALAELLEEASDEDSKRQAGITYTARMIRALRAAGAPGVHLYAFNNHEIVLETLDRAGVLPSSETTHAINHTTN